jgi:hypothetical protein
MKSATINEIRKELTHLEADVLQKICLRLAKYKVENKELITYLLYEANDEDAYILNIKEELSSQFENIPKNVNAYYIKKSLRKVLRWLNRQVKYSGIPETELDIRIQFCKEMVDRKIPMKEGTVIGNMYEQQVKKINSLLKKIPEDKHGDYQLP